jgi:hypothetical protein
MTQKPHCESFDKLLFSKKLEDREAFLRLGSDLSEPGHVLVFNAALAQETYRKCVLKVTGKFAESTAPTSVVLGTVKWRIWHLGAGNDLYIGYDPEAREHNLWWERLCDILGDTISRHIPAMCGPLVVFRDCRALQCNELELRRELINFLVSRYRHGCQYNFF